MTTRISLTDKDFGDLVAGTIVCKDGAEIALQDIGWYRMFELIEKAMPTGAQAFFRRVRRTIDDAASHGQRLSWTDAVALVNQQMRPPPQEGSHERRSDGARTAWDTRRAVNAYMEAHPGTSREDALQAVIRARE